VFVALAADTTVHVRGIGAVLEVGSAGCRQGGLKRCRPLQVGLGQSPHLIGRQSEFAEHSPERLDGIDPIEELLVQLGWQPPLRSGSPECFLSLGVRTRHGVQRPAGVPARGCAVARIGHRTKLAA
jgi:hypothetical protein